MLIVVISFSIITFCKIENINENENSVTVECRYTFQRTVHSNKTWLNLKSFEELLGRRTKLWDSVWSSNNPSRGSDNFVCQFSFNFPYYAALYEFESLTYLFLCKLHSHPNRVFQLNGLYSSNFNGNEKLLLKFYARYLAWEEASLKTSNLAEKIQKYTQ